MKRVEDEFIKEIEDRNMKEGVKKAVSEEQYVPFPAIAGVAATGINNGPHVPLQETHIQIEDATDGPTADKNQIKEVPVSGPA